MITKVRLKALPHDTPRAGVKRRRLVGERLELIVYRYEPGTTFPRHAHASEQLTIVLRGVLVFVLDEGEVRLEAGEAVVIPADVGHGAYVPEGAIGVTETHSVFTPVREGLPG